MKALLLRTNEPCETYSDGCVVSFAVVGAKVKLTAWEPKLTVLPETPLI